jgi:ABC-type lipoprotein export system ATPase subunit
MKLDAVQQGTARDIHEATFQHLRGATGTGKTTVMAAVMTAAMAANSDRCLAPTHKARTTSSARPQGRGDH